MTPSRQVRVRTRLLAALAAPLLLAVATSCTEPLAPEDLIGRYALREVSGVPLPFEYGGPADESLRLLASHVILSAEGMASTVTRVEELSGPGAPRIVEHRTNWRYEIDGARVTLIPPPCVACSGTMGTREFRLIADALVETGGLVFHRTDAVAP